MVLKWKKREKEIAERGKTQFQRSEKSQADKFRVFGAYFLCKSCATLHIAPSNNVHAKWIAMCDRIQPPARNLTSYMGNSAPGKSGYTSFKIKFIWLPLAAFFLSHFP